MGTMTPKPLPYLCGLMPWSQPPYESLRGPHVRTYLLTHYLIALGIRSKGALLQERSPSSTKCQRAHKTNYDNQEQNGTYELPFYTFSGRLLAPQCESTPLTRRN